MGKVHKIEGPKEAATSKNNVKHIFMSDCGISTEARKELDDCAGIYSAESGYG
jgi:hypothetical protein